MKIIAVSDTHGDKGILETILNQQPDADGYFYAGDSELTADDPIFTTYHAVLGNMDFDPEFPLKTTVKIDDATIFMTHGHRYGVNFHLDGLITAAQAVAADIVIYGHTHQLAAVQRAGMLIVNPGSISQPRGEFRSLGGTYAVIAGTTSQWTVQFLTRDGQPVPKLTRTFDRQ